MHIDALLLHHVNILEEYNATRTEGELTGDQVRVLYR